MKEHLETLWTISYFICPPVSEVNPRLIAEGEEEVELVVAGKVRFDLNGVEKICLPGSVFWHRAGEKTICKTFIDDPYHCFVFRFKVNDEERPGPRYSFWPVAQEVVAFARECQKAFLAGSADLDALAHYAYSTIRWKALNYQHTATPECPLKLREICDYIQNNLDTNLTLRRIAQAGGVSCSYLFTLFNKYLKSSPERYVQEQRILLAKIKLTTTNASSIKEIAAECGFNNLEVFYRQFKKQTGIPPGSYRRKYLIPLEYDID